MTEKIINMYDRTLSVIEGKVEAKNIGVVLGRLVAEGYEIDNCHQYGETVFLKMIKRMAKG